MKPLKKLLWAIASVTVGLGALAFSACSTNREPFYQKWLDELKGEAGVSVSDCYWTDEGELVLILTDGTEINVGKVPSQTQEHIHNYGGWTDIIDECEKRWQIRICDDCGDIQARSTVPKGHNYKQGICKTCNTYQSDEYNGRYGFSYLGELEKGESLQSFYQEINTVVCEYHRNADTAERETLVAQLNYADNGLTTEEALAVWKTFKQDNPLFYWLSNTLRYTVTDLSLLVEEEYADGTIRTEYNEALYAKIEDYADALKGETSEYQIALAYHDEIINAIDYAYDETGAPSSAHWAHSVVGVFDGRGAVCEGYAKAFQALLNYGGIENLLVIGEGNGEAHAWNTVRLDDGAWYYFDLTWDDTPSWEWGISYNYFAVAEGQKVNWSDGGWLDKEDKTFQTQHAPDMPTGEGLEFQYALPTVATEPFNLQNGLQLRELFKTDGNTYAVVGFNTVQLTDSDCTGELKIPETVNYDGRTYTVISVGRIASKNLFDEGNAVGTATKVSIPKTVRFIWDSAVGANGYLESITVDENNEYFTSKDGVLFTKSLYTLIQYPQSNTRTEYVIPDETAEVAYHAFTSGFQLKLKKLTLGVKMRAFGMTNWGNGYKNQAPTGWFGGNTVGSDLVVLCDNLKRNNAQFPIAVAEGNTGFCVDGIALYECNEYGEMGLVYIFDSDITTFEVPTNLKWISNVVSVNYNFNKLPRLERFVVAEGNAYFTEQDGVLYNADKTEILYVPQNKSGELIIANGVEKINAFTFDGCKKLTAVFIPKSVKDVKASAFIGCAHLTVYCEAESLPSTWDKKWNTANCTVVWGYIEDTEN